MIETITLDNGLRIVYEHIPHVRSVSFGLWLGVGSRYESPALSGAAHCIEHLLFKGTDTQSAQDLAEEMDQLGGNINAFTTKECTCFYGRVLDVNLRRLVDLLGGMFLRSRFDAADLEAERGIIGEEIDMYEDSPEDLVSELLLEAVFAGSSLGQPILGTKESLAGLTREALLEFKSTHYTPGRLVIALSGNFAAGDLDYIRSVFAVMPRGAAMEPEPAVYVPALTLREKTIEQNHLTLLFPGLPLTSEERFAAQLLLNILGGGMSSRLFQTVRERHGLCYSVYTFGASYRDLGVLGIYTALGAESEAKAIPLILDLLRELKDSGVTQAELDRARDQAVSSVLMSLESTSSRMNSLGRNALLRGYIPTPDEVQERYAALTREKVAELAGRLIDFAGMSFSVVGQVADAGRYRELLGS